MKQALIATVTFAHDEKQLAVALSDVDELVKKFPDMYGQIIIDDCSGCPPQHVLGIEVISTTTRAGYAAAVNHIVDSYGSQYRRLVLVNPDAKPTGSLAAALANSSAAVACPTVVGTDGNLQNIRNVSSASDRIASLCLGEWIVEYKSKLRRGSDPNGSYITSPPSAPAGSVISFDMRELQQLPLDPTMFWIEMSDWLIRRRRRECRGLDIEVIDGRVTHTGASTARSFPCSVAASQLAADCAFVRRYGSRASHAVLPLAITLRAFRYLLVKRSISGAAFIWSVGVRGIDWRVNR